MSYVTSLSVLSLNKSYQPIGIISLKDAMKSLLNRRAEIVHVTNDGYYMNYDINSWFEASLLKNMIKEEIRGDEDWLNSDSEVPIEAPRIIRYLYYDKMFLKKIKFTRRNIFARDEFTCQYCGKKYRLEELQLEHVVPKSKGGKSTWANTVCACHSCNTEKRNRTPEEAGMKLIRKPHTPKFLPSYNFKYSQEKYSCWRNFISDVYWNVELK